MFRFGLLFMLCSLAAFALGGQLTVTSPTNNQYVSTSNNINFNISGASVQVTVKVAVTYPTGAVSTFTQQFTPQTGGDITGSIPLDFTSSDPQGTYTLVVSATEPNNTYQPTTLKVVLLPEPPQFLSFSPVNGAFMKGTIHIRAQIKSSFLQQWRVQVNGQDIPNNTGDTDSVAVDWDTSGIEKDASETITITATDLANDTTTQTMQITLLRVPPVITVVYPSSSTLIAPYSDVVVYLDVQSEFAGAVNRTGVQVVAETMAGSYLALVSEVNFDNSTTTATWSGRIRSRAGLLPKNFKLVVTAVDRAGNSATPQTVNLTVAQ